MAPSALIHDPRIIDSWDECALAGLPRDGRFLILGAGLSALDVIAFLNAHQFRGTVSIVSRHGLLPRPHVSTSTSPLPLPAEVVASAPNDLRGLLRWGRKIIADATARGAPWQHGFDALRPHVAGAWRRMDSADRSRFVRAVRPYWEVLRHRAPEDTYALVRQWESAGRLEVFAGTLASCTPSDNGLDVVLRLPDGSERRTRYDAIVRCIGPALQREESDAPVIRALIASGIASVDPARLGIVTDEHGRVVGPDGRPSESVFALGVLRRPSSWETTAVPDIAVQARALARRIADLGRASRTSSGAPLK